MTVVLRRSSVYQIDLVGADGDALQAALDRCPAGVEVAGSAVSKGSAFVRVRAADDRVAAAVAARLAHGAPMLLRTGYGINQRVVDTRVPVGCFCLAMAEPDACLTCTCPDCGAAGRFGVSLVHAPGCGE